MRRILAAGSLAALALVAASTAQADSSSAQSRWQARAAAAPTTLSRLHRGVAGSAFQARAAVRPESPASPAIVNDYETEVVARINAIRTARRLRPLRISRGLSAAAAFHSNQMGLRGFFEHESANGTSFWRRIERFYPALPRRSWSVGENIVFGTPDISAAGAVREWMNSPPHRANVLSREWREVGIGAAHFAAAPGEFRGSPTTIVTADFGARA